MLEHPSSSVPASDHYVLTANAGRLAVGQVDHMLQMMPIEADNLVVLEFDEAQALLAEIATNADFPPLTPIPLHLVVPGRGSTEHSHNYASAQECDYA